MILLIMRQQTLLYLPNSLENADCIPALKRSVLDMTLIASKGVTPDLGI